MTRDFIDQQIVRIMIEDGPDAVTDYVMTLVEPLVALLALNLKVDEWNPPLVNWLENTEAAMRAMTLNMAKSRDELKHRNRTLVALLREARREHHRGDDQTECTTWYSDKPCNCGADVFNARIDEALR